MFRFLYVFLAALTASQGLFAAEIRRGLGPEPDSVHIHQAQGLASVNLLRDLREGLITFDSAGELVSGWDLVIDGTDNVMVRCLKVRAGTFKVGRTTHKIRGQGLIAIIWW